MAATPMAATEASDEAPQARVYAVVLNWNGWPDTLGCLESVLRQSHANLRVIVCDNASTDDSVERIRQWAAGELDALPPAQAECRRCAFPPVPKPVALTELSRQEAENECPGGPAGGVVLIHTGANLGYAGGNNVGLRYALRRGDAEYVWILNNDLVAHPDALLALVARMRQDPAAGLCGATLRDYRDPARVQARGGARYNPWLGTHRAVGAGYGGNAPSRDQVEGEMSYVIGASMFASAAWLRVVGLLSEDYFLYYEEIDWSVRGRGRFRLAYAPDCTVYHKEGESTGRPERRPVTDYLALANRLRFTRRHRPWALPTVWLGFLAVLLNRFRRGQYDRLRPILGIMFGRRPGVA